MTLDEAIAREKQLEKEQRSHIGTWDDEYSKKCEVYAEEHEQLAEWLEELKAKRKMLNFLFEVINPNDMEDYMRIYNSTDVKVEGENDDN